MHTGILWRGPVGWWEENVPNHPYLLYVKREEVLPFIGGGGRGREVVPLIRADPENICGWVTKVMQLSSYQAMITSISVYYEVCSFVVEL